MRRRPISTPALVRLFRASAGLSRLGGGLVLVGFVAAMNVACSSNRATAGDFWRDALPDPVVELEPPVPLPAAGSTTVFETEGIVIRHGPARGQNGEFTIDLRARGGPLSVHYRLGVGRMMPVEINESVSVAMWLRLEVDGQLHHGLVIAGRRTTPTGPSRQVLAVIDMQDIVPEDRLPPSLGAISPVQALAYQTGEREDGDCYVSVAHHSVSLGTEMHSGGRSPRRLVAPGGRVRLWGGVATYDVVVHDNRRTLEATCQPPPASMWAYTAVWLDTPPPSTAMAGPPMPPPETMPEPTEPLDGTLPDAPKPKPKSLKPK